MTSDTIVRCATKADAGDLAVLINIATHGLMADFWRRESGSDGTYNSMEVGRLKVLGDGELSWRNANLLVTAGETAGLLLGFSEPAPTEPTNPYAELVALAGGGWHISKLAVHAHLRGNGVAGLLLETAEQRRMETGQERLFLITPDSFSEALNFYRKRGFVEGGRRPFHMPSEVLDLGARDWVLMVK